MRADTRAPTASDASAAGPPSPASSTPFVERDEFVSALAADLASAFSGEGRIALVAGEAGIGKTTLVERFVATHRPPRVLWGACEGLSTPQPLGPLHDIARGGSAMFRERLAAGLDTTALFAAFLDELGLRPSPVVLVIDDVHWADAATLDLIRFVGRRIHLVPAVMVLAYRDDEVDASHPLRSALGHLPARRVRRLALPRLSAASVKRLATAALRSDAGVHAATGGNPFFVTEVLASFGREVPATVSDAVLARAARLDAAARTAVELAAIVPRAIEGALLERTLHDEGIVDTAQAIDACMAAGLLTTDDGDPRRALRFRHERARVAIEASIAPARARRLHARVFAILGESSATPLARLVHHAQRADDVDAVLRFGPAAAREAAARGARREAAAHCRAVLRHAARLPDGERAALLEQFASHAFELNDLAAAIDAREEAIALFAAIGDRANQGRSLAAHAMPLVRALRNADADAANRVAIEIAEALSDDALRARAYATESYLRMLNRDVVDAVAWGDLAIALAEVIGDRDTLAFAHNSRGTALLFVEGAEAYARGVAGIETSLAIARELSDGGVRVADAYVMLGTGSGEVHRYHDAERWLGEGIAFARAHDLDRLGGYMEAWQALVDVQRGRWDVAAARAAEVLEHAHAGTNRVMALVALGRLRVRRGDADAAPLLDEALDLASRSGTLQRLAPVRAARAEAAWLVGDLDTARREAEAASGLALAKRHPWFVGELALWAWRADAAIVAPATAAPACAAQIAGRWQEAARLWEDEGCPYEQASALADGDEVAQRAALAIFDRLGAQPMAERLRRAMRARGVAAVPRGQRDSTRSNAAGLTSRETEVLALAAGGLHNAQIALRLSRSVRTVEHHIAAILAKLAVATRGEAVDAARRRGLLGQDG